MTDEDGKIVKGPSESPVDDRLAHVMDWVGLSAAIGMFVVAFLIAT
ncbi:hypothetical protein [Microvirga solisilvae]|nr:hypothetical protein [Microvirga solisilvae]